MAKTWCLRAGIIIGEEEVKRMHINILVDTGAIMLAINESIQEQLQLPVAEQRKVQLANGHTAQYDAVSPVELRFKNSAQIAVLLYCREMQSPCWARYPWRIWMCWYTPQSRS